MRQPTAVLLLGLAATMAAACNPSSATSSPPTPAPTAVTEPVTTVAGAATTSAGPPSTTTPSTSTPTTRATTTTAPTTTATSAAPAGGCQLSFQDTRAPSTGRILFKNTGPNPCTLNGFPKVRAMVGGKPASLPAKNTGPSTRVTIPPGGNGSFSFIARDLSGYSFGACQPKPFTQVQVVVPGADKAYVVGYQGDTCTRLDAPSNNNLEVGALDEGTG